MDKKTLGTVALIVGIAILFLSLFADGIGLGNRPDFGRNQAIVGAILTASGVFLVTKTK